MRILVVGTKEDFFRDIQKISERTGIDVPMLVNAFNDSYPSETLPSKNLDLKIHLIPEKKEYKIHKKPSWKEQQRRLPKFFRK